MPPTDAHDRAKAGTIRLPGGKVLDTRTGKTTGGRDPMRDHASRKAEVSRRAVQAQTTRAIASRRRTGTDAHERQAPAAPPAPPARPPRPKADAHERAQPRALRQPSADAHYRSRAAHPVRGRYLSREQRIELERAHRAGLLGPPGFAERFARDIESAAVNFVPGVYQVGKAATLDVNDLLHGRPRRATRLAEIGKTIGQQYARDYRHPLRHLKEHPGFVALDVGAALSAGAGTASRASAAASAARQARAVGRNPVTQALARPGYEGGSLLKRPLPPPRTHIFEGQPVRGRYSENPAARAVQRAHDRLAERSATRKVAEGRAARVSTISAAKAERLLSEKRRLSDAAAKAPHIRALAISRKTSTPEDMAIRVVAEGVPVDEVIEAHLRAARQVEVRRRNLRNRDVPGGGFSKQQALRLERQNRELLRKAALLQEAKRYLDVDEDGRPVISPRHPELQAKLEVAETSALTREARLKKAGLLTLQQAESRKHAPGRIAQETVSGGRAVKRERPRTLEEAEARLQSLEDWFEPRMAKLTKLLAPMFEHMPGGGYRGGSRRVMPPDFKIGRGQTGYFREDPRPPRVFTRRTRQDQAYEYALKRMQELADKYPFVKDILDRMDEIDNLRAAIQAEREKGSVFEGITEAPASGLGTVTEFVPIEEAPFTGGRFRVPDVVPSKRPHGPIAYRGGVPRKPGTLTHSYTGALRQTGQYTPHTLLAIAEDALRAERYLSAERFRQELLPMGHKVRPADTRRTKWVPLRERPLSRAESDRLRKILEDVDPERLTPEEAARVEAAVKAWEEELFPERRYASTPPGTAVPGIVWVDKKLLGSQRKLVGNLGLVDVIQDAVKGLILYAKLGYLTPNLAGNVLFNVFQQGVVAPANWVRAARLPRDLGFMVDEVMGHGFARALAEGTRSPISRSVTWAADKWSVAVDVLFRRAAFVHEARKRGFRSDEDLRRLILDGRHRETLAEMAQRSRDAIIDYERMGPVERDIVRRAVFVYPWIKGSTWYAGQFLRDHPIQAASYAAVARAAEARSREEFGALPSWARGLFKVGERDGRVLAVNPAAVSPFSSVAQLVAIARAGGLGQAARSERFGELLGPVVQAGAEAAFGRDMFTGRELRGPVAQTFVQQLGKGLPQYQLYRRGALDFLPGVDAPPLPEDAAYPYTPGDAWLQYVVGSAAPRPVNVERLNRYAENEELRNLTSIERLSRRLDEKREQMLAGLRRNDPSWLTNPEDRRALESAWRRQKQVEVTRARIRKQFPTGGEPYQRAALEAEVKLLRRWGLLTPEDAREALRAARREPLEEVEAWRDEFRGDLFESEYLGILREAREAAGMGAP